MSAQPTTDVAQRDPMQMLVQEVNGEKFREQVKAALPANVPEDRFVRVAITALRETPALLETDKASLFGAFVKCAQDGLVPDGREAALVIYNTKVKTDQGDIWVKKAQYIAMIGGYRKVAAEHGWSLRTQVVYENDDFDFELGLDQRLIHRPVRPGAERGDPIAAYAVAEHKDGRREFEVLTAADIEKVKAASRASARGPWVDWPDRMWEKSAGRRLFAKLPLDEADKIRIDRVLAAELPPGEAARTMYGNEDRVQLPAIPPAPSTPEPVADARAAPAAGDGAPQTPAPAAASADPDFDGEEPPEPQFVPPPSVTGSAPTQEELRAAGAGETKFLSGKHAGQTIREVYESDPSYIKWAASAWKTPDFKAALQQYVASQEGGA